MIGVLRSGLASVLLHWARSLATIACAVAVVLPFVVGVAISEGLRDQAETAARFGADLTVTGLRYGRPSALPVNAVDVLSEIPGVEAVQPRIVGVLQLGAAREPAVLVGVDRGGLPDAVAAVTGRLYAAEAEGELVMGAGLARRLGLVPGDRVPPFYRNREGSRISEVVGVFHSGLPAWDEQVIFASLATAQAVFDEKETANQMLVTCRDGYEDGVRRAIVNLDSLAARGDAAALVPRVLSRGDREAVLAHHASRGAGVFALHFVLLFAAAIPLIVVASGVGLRERRRETGVLKMLGWGTDEVLLRVFTESLVLAMVGGSIAVLLAALWLGPLEARGISSVLLPLTETSGSVPWRLTPGPALSGAAIVFAVVLVGTLPSSWRAATAAPMDSMR
ncbi:MAG: ABC transporter permease [Planctomycetota bacterium]|jgi:ABC-type lipoprotein release transport system permease subunit